MLVSEHSLSNVSTSSNHKDAQNSQACFSNGVSRGRGRSLNHQIRSLSLKEKESTVSSNLVGISKFILFISKILFNQRVSAYLVSGSTYVEPVREHKGSTVSTNSDDINAIELKGKNIK